MSTNFVEGWRLALSLSGILAGFAITIVVGLISIRPESKIASLAIASFVLSAALLLITAFGFTLMLTASTNGLGEGGRADQMTLVSLGGGMGVLLLAALVAFSLGVSLMGFLRSRVVGIFSAVVMTGSLLAIIAIGSRLVR